MASKGHVYEAEDGFRWHLKAGNGRIVAESGESYDEERKAQAAFTKVFGDEYVLVDSAGEELPRGAGGAARSEAERPTGDGGSFAGLPQNPKHPLYSPLTVDGNK